MGLSFEPQKIPVPLTPKQEEYVINRSLRILREETLGKIHRISTPDQLFLAHTPVVEKIYFEDKVRLETTSVVLAIERAVFEIIGYTGEYRFPTLTKDAMNRVAETVMGSINAVSIPQKNKHHLPPRLGAYISVQIIKQEDMARLHHASMRRLSVDFMSTEDRESQRKILEEFERRAQARQALLTDNLYLEESYQLYTSKGTSGSSDNISLGKPKHLDMNYSQAETSLVRFVPRHIQQDDTLMPEKFSWYEQDEEFEDVYQPTALRGRMLYTLLERKVIIYMFGSMCAPQASEDEKRKSDTPNLLQLHKEIKQLWKEAKKIDRAVTIFIDPGYTVCNEGESAVYAHREEYRQLLLEYLIGNTARRSNIKTQIQEIERLLALHFHELTLSLETFDYESRLVEASQMIKKEKNDAPDIHRDIHRPDFVSNLATDFSTKQSPTEEALEVLCIPNKKHNIYTRFLTQTQVGWFDRVDIGSKTEEYHVNHLKNIEHALHGVQTRKLALYYFACEYAKKHPEHQRNITKLCTILKGEIESLGGYATLVSHQIEWCEIENIDPETVTTQLREEYDFLRQERVRLLDRFMRSTQAERISIGQSIIDTTTALHGKDGELYDRGVDVSSLPKNATYTAEDLSVSEQIIMEELSEEVIDCETDIFDNKIQKIPLQTMSTVVLNHTRARKLFLFFEGAKIIHDLRESSPVSEKKQQKIQDISSSLSNIIREVIFIERILQRENPANEKKHPSPDPLVVTINTYIAELDGLMAQLPYFSGNTDENRLETEKQLVGLYKAFSEKLTALSQAAWSKNQRLIQDLFSDLRDFCEVIEIETAYKAEELHDILDRYPARATQLCAFTKKVRENLSITV